MVRAGSGIAAITVFTSSGPELLESLYGSISWHDLHFEREKDRFRTFSGATEHFNEFAQKPCATLSRKFL